MALTAKNWTLSSYTINVLTPIVSEPGTVATVILCNTGSSVCTCSLALTDTYGTILAYIFHQKAMQVGDSKAIDVRSINLSVNQRLAFISDVNGMNVIASGVV